MMRVGAGGGQCARTDSPLQSLVHVSGTVVRLTPPVHQVEVVSLLPFTVRKSLHTVR